MKVNLLIHQLIKTTLRKQLTNQTKKKTQQEAKENLFYSVLQLETTNLNLNKDFSNYKKKKKKIEGLQSEECVPLRNYKIDDVKVKRKLMEVLYLSVYFPGKINKY